MPTTGLQTLVNEQAPAHAEEILAPLIELLGASRLAFGGDIDKFLILLAVAIRAAGHRAFAETARTTRTEKAPKTFPTLGINIQSVADSIGAPKETVRRKVSEMVEAGWIERRDHQLHLTALAYQTLAPIRSLIYAMVAANAQTVDRMREAAPNP